MDSIDKIRGAIRDYIRENGQEYERLLISEDFRDRLKEEADQRGAREPMTDGTSPIIDFPRMEIKKDADYDFKLLP